MVIAGGTPGASFEAELTPEAVDAVDLRSERIAQEVLRELVSVMPDDMADLRDAWTGAATEFLAQEAPSVDVPASLVHLSRDEAHTSLAAIATTGDRPATWCLVDEQSAGAVALADELTECWGPGLCYLTGVPWG